MRSLIVLLLGLSLSSLAQAQLLDINKPEQKSPIRMSVREKLDKSFGRACWICLLKAKHIKAPVRVTVFRVLILQSRRKSKQFMVAYNRKRHAKVKPKEPYGTGIYLDDHFDMRAWKYINCYYATVHDMEGRLILRKESNFKRFEAVKKKVLRLRKGTQFTVEGLLAKSQRPASPAVGKAKKGEKPAAESLARTDKEVKIQPSPT
ncbi:unnamed protein product, partial [marine sediment metagenome]